MVKTKMKKSKPNKQPNMKKSGKQSDISEFRSQLDALGLKIIEVTADGNCFFRALADQLEGHDDKHDKYRKMVVQYIMKNRENFEPFIEDEVPFDDYCQSMEKDGTWAGNMELQAASLVTHSNICIHRKSSPRWYLKNFSDHDAQMIHLSYHDLEHYNSVRLKEDTCTGPTMPIIIKADADLSVKSHQANGVVSKTVIEAESIKTVKVGSGPEIVADTEAKIKEIRDHMRIAQVRQKQYPDRRRKPIEFGTGDMVMLKVSPWKDIIRFGKRGKLSSRFIEPFRIVERVSAVAYRLELPSELQGIHNVFHVSCLRKTLLDESERVPLAEVQVDEKLRYKELPEKILDRKEKKLRKKTIGLVKVQWRHHKGADVTWEPEEEFKSKYPHLFHV